MYGEFHIRKQANKIHEQQFQNRIHGIIYVLSVNHSIIIILNYKTKL